MKTFKKYPMKTLILFCLVTFISFTQTTVYVVNNQQKMTLPIDVEDIDTSLTTIMFKPSVLKQVSDSLNKFRISKGLTPSNKYFNSVLEGGDTLNSILDQFYTNEAHTISKRDTSTIQVIKKNNGEPCDCYKSICEIILDDSTMYNGQSLKSILLSDKIKTIQVHYYQKRVPGQPITDHTSILVRNRFSLITREFVIE